MSSKRPPPRLSTRPSDPGTGLRLKLPKPSKKLDFDGGFPDDETPTLVTCPSCGGKWQIVSETSTGVKMSTCRAKGCVRGAMEPKDAAAWRQQRARRNISGR